MPICLVSLGSNEGSRQENLEAAAARLAAMPGITLVARSCSRETAPVGGPPGQADFLNAAVKLETSLPPHELLGRLRQIESELGRHRTERWGPRPIDLDLLLYDELIVTTPELVLPHPRMAWRRFVLEPAAEVAGAMTHATIGWSVARLLAHLNESVPYVAVTGPIAAGKTRLAERLADAISGRLILEQPDWSRLDAFYADPAGHAWATELEFLAERTRLLGVTKVGVTKVSGTVCAKHPEGRSGKRFLTPFSPPPFSHWAVSDFWFDQSAAFARAWLPAERMEAFLERYERLAASCRAAAAGRALGRSGRRVGPSHSRTGAPVRAAIDGRAVTADSPSGHRASRAARRRPGVARRRCRSGRCLRRSAGGGARNGVKQFDVDDCMNAATGGAIC